MVLQQGRARRKPRGHLLLALAAWACVLAASLAEASEPPRVVVVTQGAPSATSDRVRAELAAMGFTILPDAGAGAEPTREGLVKAARARDALASVALTYSPAGLELWVVESQRETTRLRSFVSSDPPSAPATVTLRAAELLRASLLEIAAARATVAAGETDAATPPAAPATAKIVSEAPVATTVEQAMAPDVPPQLLAAASSRSVTLRLAGGLLTSAGGLGPVPTAQLAGKLWLSERFGAELAALLPLASMSERSAEGSSRTRVGALSLALAYALPLASSAWTWDLGAGVAGLVLHTRGTPASAAYTRKEGTAFALAPQVRTALGYALSRGWRLSLGASLGVSLPRFLIVCAGRTAATWGRPFALGELAIEVDIP